MIRIDLGRGSKKQGEKIRKVAEQLKLQQPYEELLRRFDGDVSRLVTFFVAVAVAFLPYLFVGEYERVVRRTYERQIQTIEKEMSVVETEIKSLQPYKQELESYEAQKAQVTQRLAVIRQLVDSRGTPVVTLDAVTQALPEGVWLSEIVFEGADRNEKIHLAGRSLANEDVSDFVDRLSLSSYLKNVRINVVESGGSAAAGTRSFTVDLDANSVATPNREIGAAK